jgi:hypothetical protein
VLVCLARVGDGAGGIVALGGKIVGGVAGAAKCGTKRDNIGRNGGRRGEG